MNQPLVSTATMAIVAKSRAIPARSCTPEALGVYLTDMLDEKVFVPMQHCASQMASTGIVLLLFISPDSIEPLHWSLTNTSSFSSETVQDARLSIVATMTSPLKLRVSLLCTSLGRNMFSRVWLW